MAILRYEVLAMMRNGIFTQGPMVQQKQVETTKYLKSPAEQCQSIKAGNQPQIDEQRANIKHESQMIISFIPTTPQIPVTSAHNNFGGSSAIQGQMKQEEFAKLLPEYGPPDEHPWLDAKSDLSFHKRFLLHLPIEQLEGNRDFCNQRAVILYGIGEGRDQVKQELRKVGRDICKIWVS